MNTNHDPTAKKQILVVLYYYLPYLSGLTEYARRLAEALGNEGYRMTILATRHDSELPLEEEIHGVRVLRAPVLMKLGKGVISPAFITSAIRLAKTHDIVHFHLPLADAGLIAPFVDSKKLLITYHCDINLGPSLLNRIIERASYWLMGIAMKRAKTIVGNSTAYFRTSRFEHYRDRFVQIYPPIETNEYQRVVDANFLTDFGVRPDACKIGFVGRIVYEKGLNYLFQAIPYLKKDLPDFQIIIAGDGDVAGGGIKHLLEKYLDRYPEHIVFTGRLSHDQLVRFYSNIDILTLPSIDPLESFGMVQVEAMCCGTPVVASDMPGVNEAVSRTGFGRLAKPADPGNIAEAIIEVATNSSFGSNFREEEWDIRNTVEDYIKCFKEFGQMDAEI